MIALKKDGSNYFEVKTAQLIEHGYDEEAMKAPKINKELLIKNGYSEYEIENLDLCGMNTRGLKSEEKIEFNIQQYGDRYQEYTLNEYADGTRIIYGIPNRSIPESDLLGELPKAER